jgi:hypothetical protein
MSATSFQGAAEMIRAIVGACVALAFTAGVGAQDKKMATEKMNHMAKEKAYSGCVESSQTGSYTLTHSMIAAAKKSMKKADAMAPASLVLSAAGPSVDLSTHVGHKVTVTGTDGDSMNGMATFKVKSLKVIGASCS